MVHRRIKSKNRKKLKSVDPFNYRAAQNSKNAGKNQPPKDEDQEIPSSFRNIFLSQEVPAPKPAEVKKKRKKVKHDPNIVEGYERKPWETDQQFLYRVERNTREYVNDEMMKIKFGLDGFQPSDILDSSHKDCHDDPDISDPRIEIERKAKRNEKLLPKKRGKKNEPSSLSTDQKPAEGTSTSEADKNKKTARLRKRKLMKRIKADDDSDPLYMREIVTFGERVDAPPQLSAIPRKSKQTGLKAGAKDLLLKQCLESPGALSELRGKKRYEGDGTIKCDDPAKQRILEEERQRVIEAYRARNRKVTRDDDL